MDKDLVVEWDDPFFRVRLPYIGSRHYEEWETLRPIPGIEIERYKSDGAVIAVSIDISAHRFEPVGQLQVIATNKRGEPKLKASI